MRKDTLKGEADLMLFPLPAQIPKLEIQVPGQLHQTPRANTAFMILNTQVWPFKDPDVRRALNFAVDREETATLSGDQWLNETCQIIPPTLPGYSPYCPYTLHPHETWTAPDLAKAQSLVDGSRTAGDKVTVLASDEAWPISVPIGRYFVKLLKKLHYRATLKKVDAHALFSALGGGDVYDRLRRRLGFHPPGARVPRKVQLCGFLPPGYRQADGKGGPSPIDRPHESARSLVRGRSRPGETGSLGPVGERGLGESGVPATRQLPVQSGVGPAGGPDVGVPYANERGDDWADIIYVLTLDPKARDDLRRVLIRRRLTCRLWESGGSPRVHCELGLTVTQTLPSATIRPLGG